MEIILEPSLPHQQKAVDAVADVFTGTWIKSPQNSYANGEIVQYYDVGVGLNIPRIQKTNHIPAAYTGYHYDQNCLNLDVKMETGTGKTYVYTQVMYELHKRIGIYKFILVVPSLPIKAGAQDFIGDPAVQRHFRDTCGYDAEIDLLPLESPKKKKKGRQYFPPAVGDFLRGSNRDTKKIYVLLVNMQMLKSVKNYMLSRDDYDGVLEGFYRPYDALKATRPFLIIDEPHKFSRDNKTFTLIKEEIAPQCIIRFGATFPDITMGKGKQKKTVKDYQHLLYDLNACASFNQGLIKGVAKEHFEPPTKKEEKIKLLSTKKNDTANFQYKCADAPTRTFVLRTGDSLAQIADVLSGITITAIDKSSVELSNGQTKTVGEEMIVDVFLSSYQEQMLRLALERHFETERKNFNKGNVKIKTLALFFIDDISSYRTTEGKKAYLQKTFERLLKEKLEQTIRSLTEGEAVYKAFLEESLHDIEACHCGYFSQDNSSSDEAIAKGVADILKGKKRLLSFKDKDGRFILRRFLFSKWTLKEGWDNPNIFTIAKLRSSGSEISKMQEVGRGLRLPVNECGNRVTGEEFMLNYIVDFTEADFADKLVEQVNSEVPGAITISPKRVHEVAMHKGMDPDDLYVELLTGKFINYQNNINPAKRIEFFEKYPEFAAGLDEEKVTDRNRQKEKPVKIRKARFEELSKLWETLNERYVICFNEELNGEVERALDEILESRPIFAEQVIQSTREVIESDAEQMTKRVGAGVQYTNHQPLPYGLFLKRIFSVTNLPVSMLHKAICRYAKKHGEIGSHCFNDQSAGTFCRAFADWKINVLQGRFRYKQTGIKAGATALTYADGSVRSEIAQGRVGKKIQEGEPMAKYLYDTIAYDSLLELENIKADLGEALTGIAEVVVYGKIPNKSIAIPTIAGGTYSPDFMYVVKKTNGEKELNIVVETKDVENQTMLRGVEEAKIKCAEVFFNNLKEQGYTVHFHTQLSGKKMMQIVKEVVNSSQI